MHYFGACVFVSVYMYHTFGFGPFSAHFYLYNNLLIMYFIYRGERARVSISLYIYSFLLFLHMLVNSCGLGTGEGYKSTYLKSDVLTLPQFERQLLNKDVYFEESQHTFH